MLSTLAALEEPEATVAATARPTVSLEIDLSAVTHLDPATLRALWRISREARALGCRIQVHDPKDVLERTDSMLRTLADGAGSVHEVAAPHSDPLSAEE